LIISLYVYFRNKEKKIQVIFLGKVEILGDALLGEAVFIF